MNDIPVLIDDPVFLIVDKPPGMVVNRAENVTDLTVQDWVHETLSISSIPEKDTPYQQRDFFLRSGIVHRLDKETSGLLLIAKTPEVFLALQAQFFSRTVEKKYVGLVHGTVTPSRGTINAPVGRLPWNRRKFGVLPEGREAVTDYEVCEIRYHGGSAYSLLRVTPHTGRTHQIRIHLKHLGHTIVADPLYAGKHVYDQDIQFCPRLFLHAASLQFLHPITNQPVTVESSLPADLSHAWEKLTILPH